MLLRLLASMRLKNNVKRLAFDHEKAMDLCEALSTRFGPDKVTCATNMLHLEVNEIFTLHTPHTSQGWVKVGRPRWVMHKDVSQAWSHEDQTVDLILQIDVITETSEALIKVTIVPLNIDFLGQFLLFPRDGRERGYRVLQAKYPNFQNSQNRIMRRSAL